MAGEDAARQHLLIRAGATIATAESLTGGQLAARFTAVPGSSAVYLGGVVTYATSLKESLLSVPAEVIETYGVVSEPCVAAMAVGVRDLVGATHALATTGVAGPGYQGGVAAGTVWIAVATPTGVTTRLLSLSGSRAQIQAETCEVTLSLLAGIIRRDDPGLG